MIPTGSTGRSWLSDGSQQSASVIALTLPLPHSSSYTALLPGVYFTCIPGSGARNISVRYVKVSEETVITTKLGSFDSLTFEQSTTTFPGFVDTIYFDWSEGLDFKMGNIWFEWGLTGPATRRGLWVQWATGSPQLSWETNLSGGYGIQYHGDMEFISGSGFRVAMPSGALNIEPHRILYGPTHMSGSGAVQTFYTSPEKPVSMSLAVNTLASSGWYFTVSASGYKVSPWDIGFWQQNTGSVELLPNVGDFIVPSGSVTASSLDNRGTLQINSGSIQIIQGNINVTGSATIYSGSLNAIGPSSSLIVSGNLSIDSTGSFRGWPIGVIYSGSGDPYSLTATQAPDGTLYVQTPTGSTYIKISGIWYNFGDGDFTLLTVIDGGIY